MTIARTILARNVRAGDHILTTNGMRPVVSVVARRWPNGKAYGYDLTVEDFTGAVTLSFDKKTTIRVRRA